MSAEHIKELTTQAFLIGDLAQQCGPATFWVKQLKVDKIDERSRKLLAQCFPGFDGMAAVSKFYKQSGVRFEVTSKGTLRTETGRLRRYAGNKELPGGRYYSVCKDSSGNDDGTMVFELMSYWSSESKKFPELIDSTVHIEAAKSYRQTIADPSFFSTQGN